MAKGELSTTAQGKAQSDRIEKVKNWLVFNEPFFAYLVFFLDEIQTDEVPTMATDGKRLYCNPAFAAGLTDQEMRGVIIHEIMHCSARHMMRRATREMDIWQLACDYEINELIAEVYDKSSTSVKLPDGGLRNVAYKGMAAEAIYLDLMNKSLKLTVNEKGVITSATFGDGTKATDLVGKRMVGDIKDAPGSKDDKAQMGTKWAQAVIQAHNEAQRQGRLPAFAKRMMAEILESPRSWQDLLREFMTARVHQDYSWNRPSRRYGGSGFILPSLNSPAMGALVICVDTSGSIDDRLLKLFIGEITSLVRECRPVKIRVISIDAQVHDTYELEPDDEIPLVYTGGGGTSFIPAFEWVEQNQINWEASPACLVYLTDGQGSYPSTPPDYPVLWGLTSAYEVPFGTKVELWHDVPKR